MIFKKLSDFVDNNVVKKAVYNKLVSNITSIEAKVRSVTTLVHKSQYDTDKQTLEKNIEDVNFKKVPNTNNLVKLN